MLNTCICILVLALEEHYFNYHRLGGLCNVFVVKCCKHFLQEAFGIRDSSSLVPSLVPRWDVAWG